MNRIREDVHIHAPTMAIYERLGLDQVTTWLPDSFRDARVEDGSLWFRLALPLDNRPAHLRVREEQPPTSLALRAEPNGARPAVEALEWGLHQENANNVHVTAEFAYERAGGLLGALLESAVHAPLRRQALRDALWRLKLLAEGQVADPSHLPGS